MNKKTTVTLILIITTLMLLLSSCGGNPTVIDPPPQNINEDTRTNGMDTSFPFSFTAVDLYGNSVDESSLGEKRVYFLHYWGTWCPPCIREMPDIGAIERDYGDRVGFLGLVDDFDTNLSGAINIVEAADITSSFIMVDAHAPEMAEILSYLSSGYVPTTVLIGDGIIYEWLIGAHGAGYREYLDLLLEQYCSTN
ncbi:MAG: TlpA family protein disulfide reductase [Lachnospiraceae bacterium]|nr:TlpA family protein disulfide reductase [Lachnospiraceae bacterium]